MAGLFHFKGLLMNKDEVNAAVNVIKVTLHNRSEKHVTGAVLGELVRKITPELDIKKITSSASGSGGLSKFVEQYLAGVLVREGRQGGDWLYRIIGTGTEESQETDYSFWRAFVRPNSQLEILLSGQPLSMRLAQCGEVKEGELRLKSVSPAELDIIRSEFSESVGKEEGEDSDALPSLSLSYPEWSLELRNNFPKQYKVWSGFRIKKILELFESRLQELNLPPEERQRLTSIMRRSQAYKATKAPVSDVSASTNQHNVLNPVSATVVQNAEDSLRLIVMDAVKSMALSDLRTIKLPVGVMLDAFLNQYKK